jgi:hypothetical protein
LGTPTGGNPGVVGDRVHTLKHRVHILAHPVGDVKKLVDRAPRLVRYVASGAGTPMRRQLAHWAMRSAELNVSRTSANALTDVSHHGRLVSLLLDEDQQDPLPLVRSSRCQPKFLDLLKNILLDRKRGSREKTI